MDRKFDLEERLINFASDCIVIAETFPKTYTGNYISSQLIRSSTSPALHYGEAQAAESKADFCHKMKICLKELRETFNCLRLISRMKWIEEEKLTIIIKENNELISIFVVSLKTAQSKKSDQAVKNVP